MDFASYLRQIPDCPQPGVIYQDITTLLSNGEVLHALIDHLSEHFQNKKITKIVGIESRGFLLASALAYKLSAGLVLIRKKGKLPWKTFSEEYDLEYGKDTIEIHADALTSDDHVLLIDDIIATGGTAFAAIKLIEQFQIPKSQISIGFLLDISYVTGESKNLLKSYNYYSVITT